MPERHRRHRPRTGPLLAALLLVLLVGCGGDDGGDDAAGDATPSTKADAETAAAGADAEETADEARPSAGCGTSAQGPEVQVERTLDVGGQGRRYLLTVPDEHDGTTPLPVVLDFHGLLEGAEVHAGMSAYSGLAEEKGFVAVFPHGTGNPIHWNTGPEPENPDLVYLDAVLEQLGTSLCIDESRIYATGLSNGAMFTSLLLCERADVLAAAAPVAGITRAPSCDPGRPVPLVTFHGTADPILLFNGGVDVSAIPGGDDAAADEGAGATTTTRPPADLDGEGTPASVAAYAEANGCEPEPKDTEVSEEVVHRVYDCPAGADVEFYIVIDGGHTWPSSEFSKSIEQIVGPTTFDVDGTADAWEFMSRFRNT